MRLPTALAFFAGLAIAASLAVLDRQQWEVRYVTALQANTKMKSDKNHAYP